MNHHQTMHHRKTTEKKNRSGIYVDITYSKSGSMRASLMVADNTREMDKSVSCICKHPETCECQKYSPKDPGRFSKPDWIQIEAGAKPMLQFTILSHIDESLLYSFYSRKEGDVMDEVDRLNRKFSLVKITKAQLQMINEITTWPYYYDRNSEVDKNYNSLEMSLHRNYLENIATAQYIAS